jgi:hypothetical protein
MGKMLKDLLIIAILLLILVVLAIGGFLVYRVTRTAGRILDDVDRVAARLESMERKLDKAVPQQEIESVLEEIASLHQGAGDEAIQLKPAAEAEVKYLLKRLPSLAERYEYAGKTHSPLKFYAQLYAKYHTYRSTLTSADDFIARVATKTVTGNTYHAILKDGTKQDLAPLLTDELGRYRAKKSSPQHN